MLIIGHSLTSDLSALVRSGHQIPAVQYFDTEVGARWLYQDQKDFTLEHLVLRMTSMRPWRGLGKLRGADFSQLSREALQARCAGDAEGARRIYPRLAQEIQARGLRPLWDLAMSVLPILAEIGGTGMALNQPLLRERTRQGDQWLEQEKAALEEQLGIQNLRSHPQLAARLFGPLGAEPLQRTTTGWSTNRVSLLWARHQARQKKHDELAGWLSRLLEYGTQEKLHTTYYRKWDGRARVHALYSLGRTATGRLASFAENLMNIPPQVRELIIPSSWFDYIVVGDLGQIELRVAAHVSGDRVMQQLLNEGRDIHAITTAQVLGLPEPRTAREITAFKKRYERQRATGKMANFAIIFAITSESLRWKIFEDTDGAVLLEEEEAQSYIDAFFSVFSGYAEHMRRGWEAIQRGDPVRSLFGFEWELPRNEEGWRRRLNYPVQSVASWLLMLGLRVLHRRLKQERLQSRIIGTVHDNIVLEVPKQELRPVSRMLREVCEHPDTRAFGFTLSVPLVMEVKSGPNWAQLEPTE